MKKPVSSEKRLQWQENFRKQRESFLPIDRWCRENHITVSQYYDWHSRLKPPLLPLTVESFDELKEEANQSLTLECLRVLIHLKHDFDAGIFKRCISAPNEF